MEMLGVLEWSGAALGLIGSALLAANSRYSGYGFVFFLASNIAWFAFGTITGTWGMVWMQVGFTITSFIGLYRWLFRRTTAPVQRTNERLAPDKYLGAGT